MATIPIINLNIFVGMIFSKIILMILLILKLKLLFMNILNYKKFLKLIVVILDDFSEYLAAK